MSFWAQLFPSAWCKSEVIGVKHGKMGQVDSSMRCEILPCGQERTKKRPRFSSAKVLDTLSSNRQTCVCFFHY